MLLWGTVNPDGESDSHQGVLLRERDIVDLAESGSLIGKPVNIEHMGLGVGTVVSAWRHGKRLDCVLRIDQDNAGGLVAQSMLRGGYCKELSLGYNIFMQHSADGKIDGGRKEPVEVSIVAKGARHECYIHGLSKF